MRDKLTWTLKIQIRLKPDKTSGPSREDKSTFILLRELRSVLWSDNSNKEMHCCISVATVDVYILLLTTFRSTTIQRERTVTFPWEKWLGERATSFLCTLCIALLCSFVRSVV